MRGPAALVENAVVHCDADQPRVTVRARRENPWVVVEVVDNGHGIPSSEVDAINSGKETALDHSSGAGLWLANTIAHRSGGEMNVDVTDTGTTVSLCLPPPDV